MKDYYYLLGLKTTATKDEIKKAYRKLSVKFHPDKNDGDSFFEERFKDIQEAYEVLGDDLKRRKYDESLNKGQNSEDAQGSNFVPEIDFFVTDKREFEYDQEIKFSWRTINADDVTIIPFGKVEPIGSKTYKLKNFKSEFLTFELDAKNSLIGRSVKKALKIENRTYKELYKHFKDKISRDAYFEDFRKGYTEQKKGGSFKYDRIVRLTDGRSLQIEKFKGYLGETKVRINHALVPDGFYRLKDQGIAYEITDSRIQMEYYIEEFKQDNGQVIEIGGNRINGIVKGCPVWMNNQFAPDGIYRKGWFSRIRVKGGRIVD
jgi:curved DNA-binding protein CbpA